MKFNTQVCTTREQSERLLALGLKKETADCFRWEYLNRWYVGQIDEDGITANDIPAWSFDRMISMVPDQIYDRGNLWNLNISCFPDKEIEYSTVDSETIGYKKCLKSFGGYEISLYDSAVQCIEWLIKENHFNKQYLNESL